MRSSILGLFLAAFATSVVCDDCDCEPPSYSPPAGSSVGPPSSVNPGGPVKGHAPAPAVNPGGPIHVTPAGPPSAGNYASSGGFPLGTFNTPDNRQQWGQYDINTDYNTIIPDTGVIREV